MLHWTQGTASKPRTNSTDYSYSTSSLFIEHLLGTGEGASSGKQNRTGPVSKNHIEQYRQSLTVFKLGNRGQKNLFKAI